MAYFQLACLPMLIQFTMLTHQNTHILQNSLQYIAPIDQRLSVNIKINTNVAMHIHVCMNLRDLKGNYKDKLEGQNSSIFYHVHNIKEFLPCTYIKNKCCPNLKQICMQVTFNFFFN